jgi:polysaccharide pyruvyl transferase CsaB
MCIGLVERIEIYMAIGIVGNYGNGNEGDEAILEGVINQVLAAYAIERKDIIVFSNQPALISKKHGVQSVELFQKRKSDPMKFIATVKHNKPIIRDLDLLIMGGGGILMDLYRNNPIVYGMYAYMARTTKTPYVIYGVGAGPIATTLGRKLLRYIGNGAKVVTVRDPKSKDLLQSIGVKQAIHVIADPAFFIQPPEKPVDKQATLSIGVTAVPYYNKIYWPTHDEEKYHNYIHGMAKNLDAIVENFPSSIINFFSTKHPYDTEATKDIRNAMQHKDRTKIVEEDFKENENGMMHREILEFINQQDLIIGTRLHSIILALVAKKPIIAVSYHHKVKDFLDSIGCGELVVPIETIHLNSHDCLSILQKMDQDWDETKSQFDKVLDSIRLDSPKGMDYVKEIYPGNLS